MAVDLVRAIQVRDIAGLAKAIDPQRDNHIAGNRAEPRQCRGVTIADHDQRGAGTKLRQQTRALLTLLQCAPPAGRGPGQTIRRRTSRERNWFTKSTLKGSLSNSR